MKRLATNIPDELAERLRLASIQRSFEQQVRVTQTDIIIKALERELPTTSEVAPE